MTDQWIANDFHLSLLNKGEVTGANEMRENQATLNEMTSASFLSNHSLFPKIHLEIQGFSCNTDKIHSAIIPAT